MLQLCFWSGFGKRQLAVMVMEMVGDSSGK